MKAMDDFFFEATGQFKEAVQKSFWTNFLRSKFWDDVIDPEKQS